MRNKEKIKIFLKFLRKKYGKHTGAVHRRSRNPFQVLVSCILSQRTRDENTDIASSQLFKVAKTPKTILKLSNSRLQKLIKPSGFYRQKAKMIKNACRFLLKKYKGKVPNTRQKLLEVPGIGWKCSSLIMSYCFDPSYIPIDVHNARIPTRLGLVKEKDDVETIREKMEKLIPKKQRYHFHLEVIHFGKNICLPRNPRCKICELKKICEFYKK